MPAQRGLRGQSLAEPKTRLPGRLNHQEDRFSPERDWLEHMKQHDVEGKSEGARQGEHRELERVGLTGMSFSAWFSALGRPFFLPSVLSLVAFPANRHSSYHSLSGVATSWLKLEKRRLEAEPSIPPAHEKPELGSKPGTG